MDFLLCSSVIITTLLRMVQVYGHSMRVDLIFTYFIEQGYTVFSSNLYGRHWGNDQSVRLAKRLYDVVLRKETLNAKMHIMADGMGALVALEMMNKYPECIRSVIMLNPCLDLPEYVEFEKEHKFLQETREGIKFGV